MSVTIYGIRHHGPGCARSLVKALEADPPDLILLEAPQEFDQLIADAANQDMKPPVAAILYHPEAPQQASFYPFARFSPEWQALQWAAKNRCEVRSFDLPAANYIALDQADLDNLESESADAADNSEADEPKADREKKQQDNNPSVAPVGDPFEYFAQADGYSDGERWWNDKMEERADSASFFEAILEAVTVLRTELKHKESVRTLQREACMRRHIRKASKESFENIAVVCGAWHAPALATMPKVSEDNAILKGLPKVKIAATWTPWTYERLSTASGYRAGIRSPGWYDHLWSRSKHPFTTWVTKAARVLRKQDYEGSSASIIEATRLSQSLAGLRGRPRPGLDESLEAIRTVFCAGDPTPLALLNKPLLIGAKLGSVPDEVANLPLQKDIEATQKRLRLKPTATQRDLELDLREDSGRNRSIFLHRLQILQIRYARKTTSRSMGTFKENWQLNWNPSSVLDIVDASKYGNTLMAASGNALLDSVTDASVFDVTERLDNALLGDLPDIAPVLLRQLDRVAASTGDATELMRSVPKLVQIVRYGDVRKTDTDAIKKVLDLLTTRIHVALPGACTGLQDDAAGLLVNLLRDYSNALNTLQVESTLLAFRQCASTIANRSSSSPEPKGFTTRLLTDSGNLTQQETLALFSFAVSVGNDPEDVAMWLHGFLSGSGSVLVHDASLLALIDGWLKSLSADGFINTLPMLRRTFGEFSSPERGRIGLAIQTEDLGAMAKPASSAPEGDFDIQRAMPALVTATRIFDLPVPVAGSREKQSD